MENATGDRKSSESEKHFIAHLNGLARVSLRPDGKTTLQGHYNRATGFK